MSAFGNMSICGANFRRVVFFIGELQQATYHQEISLYCSCQAFETNTLITCSEYRILSER